MPCVREQMREKRINQDFWLKGKLVVIESVTNSSPWNGRLNRPREFFCRRLKPALIFLGTWSQPWRAGLLSNVRYADEYNNHRHQSFSLERPG